MRVTPARCRGAAVRRRDRVREELVPHDRVGRVRFRQREVCDGPGLPYVCTSKV